MKTFYITLIFYKYRNDKLKIFFFLYFMIINLVKKMLIVLLKDFY